MTDSVEKLLAAFNPNTSDDQVVRVIQILSRRMSEDDPDYSEEAAKTIRNVLVDAFSFSQEKQKELEAFQQFADSVNLKKILDNIELQIVDQSSAIQAVSIFDISWFQHTALSNEGKQKVASKLFYLCDKYAKYYNSIWESLTNNDLEAFALVSYRYE